MAATAQELIPAESWTDGITQPDVIVNDNARRLEVISLPAARFEAAMPGSPVEGTVYVLSAAWGDEVTGTLAYYFDSAWTYWTPFEGQIKEIGGSQYRLETGVWTAYSPDTSAVDTRGKQAIYVGAQAFTPFITAGPAAVAALALTDVNLLTMNFDPTTTETAYAWFALPEKWNGGTITFRVHWSHPATATNFGVVWRLYAYAFGDDDALDVALGSGVDLSDTGGTTNDLYISDESAAVTVGGTPAGGDLVLLRFRRRPTDALDTLAVDARLHGITIYVTTDQSTDA
jgi:hypothetical protein